MKKKVTHILMAMLLMAVIISAPTTSFAKLDTNDRVAAVLECWYALDQNLGVTDHQIWGWQVSNWNYLASDPYAHYTVKNSVQYGCRYASVWKKFGDQCNVDSGRQYSFFNDVMRYGLNPNGFSIGDIGRGGQCKFFADLILYRSDSTDRLDGGTHTLPSYASMHNNSASLSDNLKPGDVIFIPSTHVGIVTFVNRDSGGHALGAYMADSNWTGGAGHEIIGEHYFSFSSLQSQGYRVFKGVRYYNDPWPW